jgi:DNA-binding NtrC family response regulator
MRAQEIRLFQGNRLLIMDDDQALLSVLTEYFESEGFTVDGVTSLEQAQEKLAHSRYDVVIADLKLNEQISDGGLRIAEMLSQREEKPHLILLTGQSGLGMLRDPRMRGLAAFVHKPVRLQAIGTLVRSACGGIACF